jgi:hypothetical protein
MDENNHFEIFVLCVGDVAADIDHFYVKRINLKLLVSHLYIVREDHTVHLHNSQQKYK